MTNNIEYLRKLIRTLQAENNYLKKTLIDADIPFNTSNNDNDSTTEEYSTDQADRINELFVTRDVAIKFYSYFWGREDVYARRSKNGSYFPQCYDRWKDNCPINKKEIKFCKECPKKNHIPLKPETIIKHLTSEKEDGTEVIGIYPLLKDNTCRFVVFDFDNHTNSDKDLAKDNNWIEEINTLRNICLENNLDPLVERSRSGNGGHLWLFFDKPINAKTAKEFASLLLEKGMQTNNIKNFKYFDRIFPNQETTEYLGNLIVLPLQGFALKNGNSAFVDENMNAYEDQFDKLFNTTKLTKNEIENLIIKWKEDLHNNKGALISYDALSNRPKPWNRQSKLDKDAVLGTMHIILSDGIYIDTLNLLPSIQNQIRSICAFDNPEYYKNIKLRKSNYQNDSVIYLGKDINDYIKLPRGLKDLLIQRLNEANIKYEIEDKRSIGSPINVEFKGDLLLRQNLAAENMLAYEDGILNAATAFGKTVLSAYLISKRKISTLILLKDSTLINQWIDELNKFLDINELFPSYKTKSGKTKQRKSLIGVLQGNTNTLTGIVDIAMVPTLVNRDNISDILDNYGMVIMDECQSAASNSSIFVMDKVKAKYIYGVSATIKRSDNLDKIINMLLGPVRHRYTAKEKANDFGIEHYFIPRFTRVVNYEINQNDITKQFKLLFSNKVRNEQIINDVFSSYNNSRNILVIIKFKEHTKLLYDELNKQLENVYLIYGDNSEKENNNIIEIINKLDDSGNFVIVATGQKVGVGFNMPRLNTLFLTAPVSDPSRFEQYLGRIDRIYKNKKEVLVYDYVDSHIPIFNNMYNKRLKVYKKCAYSLFDENTTKQEVNKIYSYNNYQEVFERDLIEAKSRIIISSSSIDLDKYERIIELLKPKQEQGITITIVTNNPDNIFNNNPDYTFHILNKYRNLGINTLIKDDYLENYCVIDEDILWHGSIEFLGKDDIYTSSIRIGDSQAIQELLELTFK